MVQRRSPDRKGIRNRLLTVCGIHYKINFIVFDHVDNMGPTFDHFIHALAGHSGGFYTFAVPRVAKTSKPNASKRPAITAILDLSALRTLTKARRRRLIWQPPPTSLLQMLGRKIRNTHHFTRGFHLWTQY